MADRRVISLKETTPNIDSMRVRPDGYLGATDGSVGEGPWRYRTDSSGFIATGNDVPLDHPGIVFLGDSFVEAPFTPEDTRFVSIVERGLQGRGLEFRCLNGGCSGATTLQLFNVFINKVVPLVGEGGTVVFFVPQSDIPIYFRPHSYWYPTERYSPVVPPFEPEAPILPTGRAATASILGLLIAAAREFKIRLILVASPHRHADEWGQDEYLSRMVRKDQLDSLNQRRADIRSAIRAVVKDTRVPFIDADARLMNWPDHFYDELHLNNAGHEKFSGWFLEELAPLLTPDAANGAMGNGGGSPPQTAYRSERVSLTLPPRTKEAPYAASDNAAYAADFYYGHCTKCDAVWHPEQANPHDCQAEPAGT